MYKLRNKNLNIVFIPLDLKTEILKNKSVRYIHSSKSKCKFEHTKSPIDKVREIRDDIEQRVKQLAADLIKSSTQIKH